MIPHIVGRIPRYNVGTGTMVLISCFRDLVVVHAGDNSGDVQLAIWARRRTVSRGNLMDKSTADPRKVKIDQDVGFMAGSRRRLFFRKRGVDVEISVGIEEAKNVIGMRWEGISHDGLRVFNVERRLRLGELDGRST